MSFALFRTDQFKARKAYRCEWCGEWIDKDSPYTRYTGVMDGDFQSTRMHNECKNAMDSLPNSDLEDGFMPHDFKRGSTKERGSK